ncbi:MAG: 1-deoxy-D-xylulose-5-phosphate synthase [Candidatus Omnitrophica bacterium]|nr:1-deoxy-D-xylulose-5-phosphate synthase [Candidatus Omnitrophota bacterium]
MSQDIRDAFFEQMHLLAREDASVVFLTADMGAFALEAFRRELPGRYINVGVAEQNMISVAAGLALSGKKVFVHSIIPFVTARCYEQISVDLSVMKLPVVVVGMGAGLTYAGDGPTHHAVHDIALMRSLPDFTVFSPCDALSTRAACRMAHSAKGPVYVRLEKGILPQVYNDQDDMALGMKQVRRGQDVLIAATSNMTHQAVLVADVLKAKGIAAGVVDVLRLKPFNENLWHPMCRGVRLIVTLEEHSLVGGLGSIISECHGLRPSCPVMMMGVKDRHSVEPLSRELLQEQHGLSVGAIVAGIEQALDQGVDNGSGIKR